jgi:F0F1-type ATP synthase assembly protein I
MGLIIVGGALFGNYLDVQNEKPIWTIVFSLLGIAIGLYLVIKEVLNLGKENDKKD